MTGTTNPPDVSVRPRPQLGPARPWEMPPVATHALGNGLRTHAIDLPGRDLVAVTLRLDGPVTTEPLALAGVATMAMRALDEGTASHDGDTFAAALDRIGADWSPSVGFAGATVTVTAPVAHLDEAMALLGEAVFTATFPERDVARLIGQRRDSIARALATPPGHADIVLRAVAVDPSHRASLPSAGSDATMAALDLADVVAHHRDVLLTGPADLVVVGDLADHDLDGLAERHLAPLADAQRERSPADPVRLQPGPKLVLVDHPGAVQSEVRVVRAGPDVHAADRAAARLLGHVLGGPLTSRLDAVLREERGYTYGVRSSLRSFRRGGMFVLASGSFETSTTAEALDLVRSLSERLAAEGPTQDEVVRARDYLTGVIPLSLETPKALASVVAGNIGDDLPTDHTSRHIAALRAATRDDVAAAATEHLATDDLVAVVVGDIDTVGDDLAALGWGTVVHHDA